MDMVRTEGLIKTYGKGELAVDALRGVDISIKEGELVSIIGKSGSGKSTLLHLLGALDRPTGGEVYIDNESIYDKSDDELSLLRRRKVGFVFQSFNLLPEYTVKDNILMPLILDGQAADEAHFERIISLLDIGDKLKYYPDELSGGQIQRVAIARALITKPAIILADEPTGNLDEKTGNDVMQLLRRLNEELNQTTIIVTHDMAIARTADKMILIRDGLVEENQVNGPEV
ncbi:MAG: ABC transporter ATP-binding protein [Clostridium sp.]|jgi:putative ABC transport system ATP-binding protein|nr:ABC transporter ATP-binding protein [Clostridium sp.]